MGSMSGISSRATSCTVCATPCVRLLYRPPEILAFVFVNLFRGVTFAAGVRNAGNRHLHNLTFKFAEDVLPWSRFFFPGPFQVTHVYRTLRAHYVQNNHEYS